MPQNYLARLLRGAERLRRRDPLQASRLEQRLLQLKGAMSGRLLPVTSAIAERA